MSAIKVNEYIQNGLANNDCETVPQWLRQLSNTYGMPYEKVKMIAKVLGSYELFDGLVAAIQDEA